MADLNITISQPILLAGQYFKVRYREYPSGTFSAPQNEDNDPFTLTGLTAGQEYEIEIIVVNADESECPPSYYYGTPREYECPEFTVEQVGDGISVPYQIMISYTLPMGYVAPCKYYVRVKQSNASGGWQSASYNTLPASPFYVNLPSLPVQDYDVQIYADQCDGTFKYCYDDTVPAPEPVPCTPMTGISSSALYLK